MKHRNGETTLDATDLKILEILQENARLAYSDIGKRLGLAHSTIFERIKKMEANGIIAQYTVKVDLERMGTKKLMAMMTIYTDPKESEKVAEQLGKLPQIIEIYTSLSEELLIIAKVIAEDQESLHALIANSVAPLEGVLRIRTSIVTKKFKETQPSIGAIADKLTFIKRARNINRGKGT
ncbi:MAG: Lrp/AsnC family transcriptional regulator [Candidatus Bathyarchaeota archaeon]|jgi:Lrp/AsnC family transcriptional regulator for asnA, asnC and gidA|nr:Lrp/AsnC family transcriptional regulator [Candidatus Bathyarchaeota archaeon]